MITWMQKNKKYLVVTIWISTIAFVGAGFVGWGAYDLNSNRAKSVAKVGHRNISVQELNDKYSQLYYYYNDIFNGELTEEKASEMGLSKLALEAAIRDNLLLNYADDLGFSVSDSDIIQHIMSDENFHRDGVFDENLYKDILRRSRVNPKDYEKGLKRQILLNKLNSSIPTSTTKQDIDMMLATFFMQDKVAIKIIKADDSDIKIDENELKKLWEENKNDYMTPTTYTFDTLFVPMQDKNADEATLMTYYEENKEHYKNSEDKIIQFKDAISKVKDDYNLEQSKTEALEKYVALKNGKLQTEQSITFTEDTTPFEIENLSNLKVGNILKPIVYNNGYIISKVSKIQTPQPMDFKSARDQIVDKYMNLKTKELLENKVKSELREFKSENQTQVEITRATDTEIAGLDILETRNFIDQVFGSTNKKGYVVLSQKAIIYEILEQKLLTNKQIENIALVSENINSLKNSEIMQDLIKSLQKRYKVEEYIKR